MNKIDRVVTEYVRTGDCTVDVDRVVKQWSHLWRLTSWHKQFRLVKFLRKDSYIKRLKVHISKEQAEDIISRLCLKERKDLVLRNATYWE